MVYTFYKLIIMVKFIIKKSLKNNEKVNNTITYINTLFSFVPN